MASNTAICRMPCPHSVVVCHGRLLAPTRWKHGDTALMCLATSQIGYSWIMRPSTLPSSYVNFLNRHGGRELWHYAAVRVRRSISGAPGRRDHPAGHVLGQHSPGFHALGKILGNGPCGPSSLGSCSNGLITVSEPDVG